MRKRVHEIAKERGLPTKDVLARLRAAGLDVKASSSSVDELAAQRVLGNGGGAPAPASVASPAPTAVAAPAPARADVVAPVAAVPTAVGTDPDGGAPAPDGSSSAVDGTSARAPADPPRTPRISARPGTRCRASARRG